jgi:hypothetical protein
MREDSVPQRSSYTEGTPIWVDLLMAPFDMRVGRAATLADPQGTVFSIIKGTPPPE